MGQKGKEVELFIQQEPSRAKALPVLLAQTQKKKGIAVTIVKLKKKNCSKKQHVNKKDGPWPGGKFHLCSNPWIPALRKCL